MVQSWNEVGMPLESTSGLTLVKESSWRVMFNVVGEVFLSLVDEHAEPQEQVLGQQFSQAVSIGQDTTYDSKSKNLKLFISANSPKLSNILMMTLDDRLL